ncbi:hypothetical protein M3638_16995 [Oceanobacillus profundus]|nr:hypothetical protein [Oceanobacillus profundus]
MPYRNLMIICFTYIETKEKILFAVNTSKDTVIFNPPFKGNNLRNNKAVNGIVELPAYEFIWISG